MAARNGNTSNLILHLRYNHPSVYAEFTTQKTDKDKVGNSVTHGTHSQPSIEEALMSSQSYDNKSKKWVELTNAVTYCIAKDVLPLYTVEKAGFRKCWQHLTRDTSHPTAITCPE